MGYRGRWAAKLERYNGLNFNGKIKFARAGYKFADQKEFSAIITETSSIRIREKSELFSGLPKGFVINHESTETILTHFPDKVHLAPPLARTLGGSTPRPAGPRPPLEDICGRRMVYYTLLTTSPLWGGGCLVLIPASPTRASSPITVQPVTADHLRTDHGGSPFFMELIALTGGLQLLAHLHVIGTVITDCQSLSRKLQQGSVLRWNIASSEFPLLRKCLRLISPARAIQRVKGHAERSASPNPAGPPTTEATSSWTFTLAHP